MGKNKSLKTSMKAIHEAISSFKTIPPICMQQSRTDSFRDLYTSFNSIYYTPPSSSSYYSSSTTTAATTTNTTSSASSSSDLCHAQRTTTSAATAASLPSAAEVRLFLLLEDDSFACSNVASTSSSSVSAAAAECELEPCLPSGAISSRRFFFSPRITKSIMEEGNLELGLQKIQSFDDPPGPNPVETEEEDEEVVSPTASDATTVATKACFCEESFPMVMASEDPYKDFRMSMEEMVVAHGLTDWSGLQELLYCYLKLNDKKTHKIIMRAFLDLLMHFISFPPENKSSSSISVSSSSSSSYSSPLLQLCSD